MSKKLRWAALPAALALALTLPLPVRAAGTGYSDVPQGAWYAEAAAYCREHGLLYGTGEDRFSPELPVSRGMLAAVLHRLAGSPAAAGELPFTDVAPGAWYADAVRWAGQRGYMSGYGEGLFGPEDPVTREQLAAVLWRYAGSPAAQAEDFADEGEIAPYALPAVDWTRSAGLISGVGDNRFAPGAGAARSQLAVILMNFSGLSRVTSVSAIDVMCQPCGVAAMPDGSLLVTDQYNKVIWRVTEGRSSPFAGADTVEDVYGQPVGGYHDAALLKSLFKDPWAIAPFLGGWAVSDAENGVVRFLRPDDSGTVNRTGVTDLGVSFDHPTGLAADDAGSLYVSDTFLGVVKKITPAGQVSTWASGLTEPMGLCWADGSLYIAECGGNRILKVGGDKKVTVAAGSGTEGEADGPAAQASFSGPKGVAVAADGTIYVADTDNGTVRRVRDGQVTTILSRDPRDVTALFPAAPTGLLIQGNTLYISDTFARKLLALPLD
ncbi:MAG: hypothetical protein HFF52_05870 [Lawsonibacter sp.]|nr:hypothetical protein [Lawsonibacter sp.]